MFFKRLHPGRYIVCKVEIIKECVQLQTTCTKETGNGSDMIKPAWLWPKIHMKTASSEPGKQIKNSRTVSAKKKIISNRNGHF